jgi:predicted HAD superfamily Cof-like phosphohydrolase
MKDKLNKLEIFQKSFNSTFNEKPTLLAYKDFKLRYELMKEENEEYLQACEDGNMIEIADALGDQLFVLLGTIVSHGFQNIIGDIFNEITASNMSKLDEDGKPIINGENGVFEEDKALGKILKPKNYFKPNLEKVFENHKI